MARLRDIPRGWGPGDSPNYTQARRMDSQN